MSVTLRDGAYFKDRRGHTSHIEAFTSTTQFAFRDKWSGRKFNAEGKSAVAPDFDLIEEATDEVPVFAAASAPAERAKAPWTAPGNVVHFPDNKEVRGLCVAVWCGEIGLLVADVEVGAGAEGAVKVRKAWLESDAGSIGLSEGFLGSFALKLSRGLVPASDLIAARAREEAWG